MDFNEQEFEQVQQLVSRLVLALRRAIETPSSDPALVQDATDFPDFAALHWDLTRLGSFAYAVSQGDLTKKLVMKGFLPGALKTLQANLGHLTWQTKMIATGDLTQRVDFMGEFSRAFNAMVTTLEDNQRQLLRKEEALQKANDQLRAEVAERARAQRKLENSQERYRILAMRDSLSALYNRRYFFLLGKREVNRAVRTGAPLSIIMFDIDHFKVLNDTFGHAAGDQAIRAIGRITRQAVRDVDLAGRYGGEEFVVLLPECPRQNAVEVAERLRAGIASHVIQHGEKEVRLTASFGVATFRQETGGADSRNFARKLDALAALADQAMYRAKAEGRDRVVAA